jgi:valyl-tRNA synthetase
LHCAQPSTLNAQPSTESVHLATFPVANEAVIDKEQEARMAEYSLTHIRRFDQYRDMKNEEVNNKNLIISEKNALIRDQNREIRSLKNEIEWMRSSKFWKMRDQFMKLRGKDEQYPR